MDSTTEISPLHASGRGGTDARGAGGRTRGHRPVRKSFAIAAALLAAVLAAGVATGAAPHSPAGAAGAATTRNWIATSGTIFAAKAADPATTAHFFNTASSFSAGANPAASPVPNGYATTPVLDYTSYAQFASDIASGAITYPFKWVMYDPEEWAATPVNEQQDPVTYMQKFAALAHAHGLKVIMAPAIDLAWVPGSVNPIQKGETGNQWYVRVIAGPAGADSNLVDVQDESNTTNISQYQWTYSNFRSAAKAANPGVTVDSEVSTMNGTASQMATAAQSVNADGYFVAAAGDTATTGQFLDLMQAAGY